MEETGRLSALFVRWKEFYRQNGLDPEMFFGDGIIDEAKYSKAKKKILFILREINESGGDLTELIRQGHRHNVVSQLSQWAAGILNDFPEYEEIDRDQQTKAETLESVALLNLKKNTGETALMPRPFDGFSLMDKSFVVEEIDVIKPEIIISCNVITELVWALDLDEVKCEVSYPNNVLDRFYHHRGSAILFWSRGPDDEHSHEDNYNHLKRLFQSHEM